LKRPPPFLRLENEPDFGPTPKFIEIKKGNTTHIVRFVRHISAKLILAEDKNGDRWRVLLP
jgi:hypothetical protein